MGLTGSESGEDDGLRKFLAGGMRRKHRPSAANGRWELIALMDW